jgi:DNA-binding response OmpR family regulator
MTSDDESRLFILLVEDEEHVRLSLERYLAAAGYDVLAVEDADAAFAILEGRAVDAVIVDVRLSKARSGLEVLQFADLYDRMRHVLRIVLTGVALSTEEEEILRRHPAYVFYKPHGYADLVAFLRERLAPRSDGSR